ncbi:MAG: hypothetical protein JWM85_2738 [Acidimicrobiaceae bacterium]|nr:hypothetical protein [Acidimicrobiaceae bacterium]
MLCRSATHAPAPGVRLRHPSDVYLMASARRLGFQTRCRPRSAVDVNPPSPASMAATPFSYILPLATNAAIREPAFTDYLSAIGGKSELIVVDDSPPEVFEEHHRMWGALCLHVRPYGDMPAGKVANVMTGVRLAHHDRVVIADDDVRYESEIYEIVRLLDDADVVRPQNYFFPVPWHAAWDSSRSLLARLYGGDWPGTLGIRRSTLLRAGGYASDVLFENYELCKTIEAVGGRHLVASDVFVRRIPPTTDHFVHQRVRQAYDELARPWRFIPFLAVLPGLGALVLFGRRRLAGLSLVASASGLVLAAEVGRRRGGASRYFPLRSSLTAPLWVLERSACVWLALGARTIGGVRYRGRRVRRAALPPTERRARLRAAQQCAPGADLLLADSQSSVLSQLIRR